MQGFKSRAHDPAEGSYTRTRRTRNETSCHVTELTVCPRAGTPTARGPGPPTACPQPMTEDGGHPSGQDTGQGSPPHPLPEPSSRAVTTRVCGG